LRSAGLPLEDLAAFVMSANNGRQRGFRLNFAPLRAPLDRELAWCCWRIIELGGRVPVPAVQSLLRWLAVAVGDQPAMRGSLMQHSPREWERAIRAAFAGRRGRLPGPVWVRNTATLLRRCYQLLWAAYDRRPWWRREVWNLALDPRIPRRPHEPAGAQGLYFHQLEPAWLRLGMQWSIRSGLQVFADWLGQRGPVPPWLCDDPAEVRVLMLEFLGHVRGLTARSGPNLGKPLSDLRVNDIATNVEQFYLFMHDNREAAARALDEPGWLRLGLQHATLWRRGETRRSAVRPERREVIDDTAFSQIMANLHLLGASAAEGGFGDEQVMRIVMLVARTGRRVSEIRMLDRDPLLPLDRVGGSNQGGDDDGGFVAKLRDQQTKIDRAPDTMLVDAEIVAIIGEQQRWVDEHLCQRWAPRTSPRYLFLAARMNRHADKPYTLERIHLMVGELARRLGIRDGVGRLVDFNRTHRFRHTRATSLLNAGVPLHVVQRYLGHLTPAMTMEYAETLAETHEREFLRYRSRAEDPTDPHRSADRRALPGVRRAHRAAAGQRQRLAGRPPPGAGRPGPHHRRAGKHRAGRQRPSGGARRWRGRPHRRHHRRPDWEPPGCGVPPTTCAWPPPARALPRRRGPSRDWGSWCAVGSRSPSAAWPRRPGCRWSSSTATPSCAAGLSSCGPSSVIRTLTAQITELKLRHREEVQALKHALEAAHGENLELRRRLGHRQDG